MKKLDLVLFAAVSVLLAAATASRDLAKEKPAGPVATPTMLVVGEKPIFLLHLPMFQVANMPPMPRRYQSIMKLELQQTGINAGNTFMKDRKTLRSLKLYINPGLLHCQRSSSRVQQPEN